MSAETSIKKGNKKKLYFHHWITSLRSQDGLIASEVDRGFMEENRSEPCSQEKNP